METKWDYSGRMERDEKASKQTMRVKKKGKKKKSKTYKKIE